jgi:hypothetical protein
LPFLWFILIVSGFFHPTAIGRSYLLAPAELASPGFTGEGVKKSISKYQLTTVNGDKKGL